MHPNTTHVRSAIVLLSLVLVSACGGGGGGGGGDGSSGGDSGLGVSASPDADRGSSYENSKTDILPPVNITELPDDSGNLTAAVGYLDADGDGSTDVFIGTGEFLIKDEIPSELYLNDGNDNFNFNIEPFNGDPPPATHARKTLVADFNNDSLNDLLVLDHGFDAPPKPGSTAKLVIQETTGSFSWERLSPTGFYHGGAAGDIDNDGDIDVFMGNDRDRDMFFYVNDGSGSFEVNRSRLDINLVQVFTAELIDVDEDGFIDLLAGGHEAVGDVTTIYWGGTSGIYTENRRTHLPPVDDYSFVVDFDAEDVDGDGDRDLVINRTAGDFDGRRIQLLTQTGTRRFSDVTKQNVDDPAQPDPRFVQWLRVQDVTGDGHRDIFSDDLKDDWLYVNDGDGNFARDSFNP